MIGLNVPKKDTKYVIEEYLETIKVNLTYSELTKVHYTQLDTEPMINQLLKTWK